MTVTVVVASGRTLPAAEPAPASPTTPAKSETYADRIRVAREYYVRAATDPQNYELAAERFAEAAEVAPDARTRADAQHYRGESLAAMGRYADAELAFTASLTDPTVHPDPARGRFRRAEMAHLAGHHDVARTAVQDFLANHGASALLPHGQLLSAKLDRAAGQYADAESQLRRVLTETPAAPVADECRLELGRCEAAVGKPDEAIRWWTLLAETPGHPLADEAAVLIGQTLVEQDKAAEAVTILAPIVDRLPREPFQIPARLKLAEAYLSSGQPALALTQLDRLPQRSSSKPGTDGVLTPDQDVTGTSLRLRSLKETGRIEAAQTLAKQVLDSHPQTPLAEEAAQIYLFSGSETKTEQDTATFILRAQETLPQLTAGPYYDFVATMLGHRLLVQQDHAGAAKYLMPAAENGLRAWTSRTKSAQPEVSLISPSTRDATFDAEQQRIWTLFAAAALAELGRGEPAAAQRLLDQFTASGPRHDRERSDSSNDHAWKSLLSARAEVGLATARWHDAAEALRELLAFQTSDGPSSLQTLHRRRAQLAYALAQEGRADEAIAQLGLLPDSADAEPWTATALAATLSAASERPNTLSPDSGTVETAVIPHGPPKDLSALLVRAARLSESDAVKPSLRQRLAEICLADAVSRQNWQAIEALTGRLLAMSQPGHGASTYLTPSGDANTADRNEWTQLRAKALLALDRTAEAESLLTGTVAHDVSGSDGGAEADSPNALSAAALSQLSTDSLRLLAVTAKRSGDLSAEVERLTALHERQPEDVAVTFRMGWALASANRFDESDERFADVIAAGPNSSCWADAVYRLAERAATRSDVPRAKRFVSMLLAYAPDAKTVPESASLPTASAGARPPSLTPDIEAHAMFLDGQLAATERNWRHCHARMTLLINTHDASSLQSVAHYWIAESDYQLGRFADAGKRFEVLATKPSQPGELWRAMVPLRIGQLLASAEQWTDALAVVSEIETTWPEFRQGYEVDFLRGRCLFALGRLSEARTVWERVVRSPDGGLTETAAHAQWMIGESFVHQARHLDAIRAFELVEMTWKFPKWQALALLEAGKCHDAIGDRGRAAHSYAELVRRFPSSPEAKQADERLRSAGTPSASPVPR